VISPLSTFITHVVFTQWPFQNAGVKHDYAVTDKIGIMVGAFNDA
jgi:hypothetical protein